MLTHEEVHIAIDTYWAAQLPSIPTIFTNQDDTQISEEQNPWVKQKVVFREAKQFELGNTNSSRNFGAMVFIIYVRKGTGTQDRDRLYQQVVDSFRSRQVGGATFQNVQPLTSGQNENWHMSAYQIPFYFNSI